MLKIGDFSRICQVTIKTLRHYDRLGLLRPAHIDTFTGHRYYSMSQMPRVNRILALKDLGLSLGEIKQVLDDNLSMLEIQGMLHLKQTQIRSEIISAQSRLHRIESRINQLNQENIMPDYEVIIKSLPAQRVLAIREILVSSDEIPHFFAEIAEALKAQKIETSGAWIALYHHEGFRDTNLDIEIAIPVDMNTKETVVLDDKRYLRMRELTGYEEIATVVEDGHKENWSGSYTALGQFIESNPYEIVGAVREVYLTAPDDDAGWLIEIQMPVQEKLEAMK